MFEAADAALQILERVEGDRGGVDAQERSEQFGVEAHDGQEALRFVASRSCEPGMNDGAALGRGWLRSAQLGAGMGPGRGRRRRNERRSHRRARRGTRQGKRLDDAERGGHARSGMYGIVEQRLFGTNMLLL